VKLNFAYQFIRTMDKLFIRVESYLHDVFGKGQKIGISLYSGDSKEMQDIDNHIEWKAFTNTEPLVDQVNSRIMQEARRTQHRLQRNLDARRQTRVGVEEYIWRSQGDEKVRSSHAQYDDRVFRWDTPPPDGHPGQAYGCRCVAEPVKPRLSQEEHERLRLVDPPIESVYPELLFIGIGRAAWSSVNAALRGIQALGRNAGKNLARYRDEQLFRRPRGVPKDWVREPAKKGEGVKYVHPNDRGTYIKIQKARPNSSNVGQKIDNIRWQKNGKTLDKNGKIVPKQSEESHIPVKDFKFRPELFK
jgi:SPP1 gp7 family putative phage head morphogenesis protein